jgi:hypothetical protein
MYNQNNCVRTVYGAPVEDITEQRLLTRLVADLESEGIEALLLANFQVGYKHLQIDLVVATTKFACVVEIKGYKHPVQGQLNGPWTLAMQNGEFKSLGKKNPYCQARDARFAILDELRLRLVDDTDRWRPSISGIACLFPAPVEGSEIPPGDFKADIGGYEKLLSHCRRAHPRAVQLAEWMRIANELGLSA